MGLFRRFRDRSVGMDERSPRLGLKYKDLLMLKQLAETGADLHQPRHLRYFLYVSTPEVALAMAEEVRAYGMEAETSTVSPDGNDEWQVLCQTTALLTPEFVRETGDFFDDLARRHRGQFDGWEAAARP